jgi:DNA-binding NarL/FixJ family response regulator
VQHRPSLDPADPAPVTSGPRSQPGPTVRVVVGEDNLLAREGILRVLERIAELEVVAVAHDLDSLRGAIERTDPDVVLTDIRMPPTHTDEGIRLAAELRVTHPTTGVVVLSQHAEPQYASALFATGSDRRAYLLKERVRDSDELQRALTTVAAGGSLVDPRIVDELLKTRDRVDATVFERLTPREHELLGLMAQGLSNGAIAVELKISKRGIERHINSIFSKLDLGDAEDVSRRVKASLLYLSRSGR